MLFADAFAWLFSPDAAGIPVRIVQHLAYTLIALGVSSAIAIPIGYWIGHTGRGRDIAVGLSGAARALPSLGLITILALLVSTRQALLAATITFVVLGVPSILAGAYSGLQSIDRRTIDAARAQGMTEWQILWQVEIPLGLPLLVGGLRNAALQVVATATLAAYITLGGLGGPILAAIPNRRFDIMLGTSLVLILLAIALDAVFALLERVAVPKGVALQRRGARPQRLRPRPTRSGTTVGSPTT
jgi:osmoprotectant transport system permease protein